MIRSEADFLHEDWTKLVAAVKALLDHWGEQGDIYKPEEFLDGPVSSKSGMLLNTIAALIGWSRDNPYCCDEWRNYWRSHDTEKHVYCHFCGTKLPEKEV